MDFRLHIYTGARIQETKHVLAQLKQRLVEVWADFEQTIVDKRQTSGENDSGPVSRLKDSTFTHAVTCDAAQCLNRRLYNCFSLRWYHVTNTDFV